MYIGSVDIQIEMEKVACALLIYGKHAKCKVFNVSCEDPLPETNTLLVIFSQAKGLDFPFCQYTCNYRHTGDIYISSMSIVACVCCVSKTVLKCG